MKKFVTIIVITLLAIPTFAQTLRFGVRGGYDFIDQTVNKDILNASNRTGFHIGPTLDINIPALPFAIDVSTLYTQQNIKTNNSDYTVEKAYFLDVPVNLKYTIGLGSVGLVLSAGPYARFNLDGGPPCCTMPMPTSARPPAGHWSTTPHRRPERRFGPS